MKRQVSLQRGIWTGIVSGLVGCATMAGFQELVARASQEKSPGDHGSHAPSPTEESTTEAAARRAARQFGHSLSRTEKQRAGRMLHYGFGALMGAAYGVAVEFLPVVGIAGGVAFGTVLFAATDEAMLPLLKLASQPNKTPAADHVLHWASHVAYSSAMELTRRALVSVS